MYTTDDFKSVFQNVVNKYPSVALLYEAGDNRTMALIDTMSSMLAMLSAQVETALIEPYEKTRTATLLADAALRDLLPKANPTRVKIAVTNKNTVPFLITANRTIIDSNNRYYRAETTITVPAKTIIDNTDVYGTEFIEATQITTETINHVVTNSEPFYAIEIQPVIDDNYLSSITVSDSNGAFLFRERFINSLPNERVFTVETDIQGRFYVRFGWSGKVGIQPIDGATIIINIVRTLGDINLNPELPFYFEYTQSINDANIDLILDSVIIKGENPYSQSYLRDLCRYPSVYNASAVYLGDFEFLIRRNFPMLQFISIWNESIEESHRGANVSNINTLFVACFNDVETLLTENGTTVTPLRITNLTTTQELIKSVILKADNSYKVVFYTPIIAKYDIAINVTISNSYNLNDIESLIKGILIAEYGKSVMTGQKQLLVKRIYELLKIKLPALNDVNSDLSVFVTKINNTDRPELWRYIDNDSIIVNITYAVVVLPSWS